MTCSRAGAISNSLRFWTLHGLLPVLLFLPLALALEHWPIDVWVDDHFYDSIRAVWIGDHTWWATDLIHEDGSRLILLVALSSFALWVASLRCEQLRAWRRPALFVGLCILASTALVEVVKLYSNVDCPEDLLHYGGERAYAHVFADKAAGAPRGTCFPGGHSSGAFSLIAFYFLLRERRPRRALLALTAALLLGGVYAFGQWTRGEHFPSHDAWSAVICWYVALGLYAAVFKGRTWFAATIGRVRVAEPLAQPVPESSP